MLTTTTQQVEIKIARRFFLRRWWAQDWCYSRVEWNMLHCFSFVFKYFHQQAVPKYNYQELVPTFHFAHNWFADVTKINWIKIIKCYIGYIFIIDIIRCAGFFLHTNQFFNMYTVSEEFSPYSPLFHVTHCASITYMYGRRNMVLFFLTATNYSRSAPYLERNVSCRRILLNKMNLLKPCEESRGIDFKDAHVDLGGE